MRRVILGILKITHGGAAIVSLPPQQQTTRNVGGDEALIGVLAGAAVLVLSFVPPTVGTIVLLMKKNKLKVQV